MVLRQQVRRMCARTKAKDWEKNRHLLQGMALRLERQAGLQMAFRGVSLLRSRGVIPENTKKHDRIVLASIQRVSNQ